jgi:hypothetical protein
MRSCLPPSQGSILILKFLLVSVVEPVFTGRGHLDRDVWQMNRWAAMALRWGWGQPDGRIAIHGAQAHGHMTEMINDAKPRPIFQ